MGKPAARLGDPTVHGGAIVVGFPTVLIGGMPAARIGDMHVCPMLNPGVPPPPHVGGPVMIGSPTVLIGGVPAARMGDMATCAGPPDTIIMGCPTVLIGEAGGGSGSGGGAGAPGAAQAARASVAAAQFNNVETTEPEPHWVQFDFVDKAGLPVSGVAYAFTDPEKNESASTLKSNGRVRRDGLAKEGNCEVALYDVYDAAWDKEIAEPGDTVKASARVEGFEDGTKAEVQIAKRDIAGADVVLETLEAEVRGGKVEATWTVPETDAEAEVIVPAEGATRPAGRSTPYSAPDYYFDVVVGHSKARSGRLYHEAFFEIEVTDEDGKPLAGEDYVLYAPNGEVRQGTLDGSGKAREEKIPAGLCDFRLPNIPDIDATGG